MAEFVEVLKALPALVWSLVGAVALWRLAPHVGTILPRVGSIEVFGLKMSLRALDEAVKERPGPVDQDASLRAAERLRRDGVLLHGREILWVDDVPSNNRYESRMFQAMGASVTFAASTDEALDILRRGTFHLILSDMGRNGVPDEGERMLTRLRQLKIGTPVIFYTSDASRRVPDGAQGIADQPQDLALRVLDVLSAQPR